MMDVLCLLHVVSYNGYLPGFLKTGSPKVILSLVYLSTEVCLCLGRGKEDDSN